MSAMFVDAGETVSRQCLEGDAYCHLYVEPLRCATRRRRIVMFAHGRETVSAQCLTKLAGFFTIPPEQHK